MQIRDMANIELENTNKKLREELNSLEVSKNGVMMEVE